jgi:hypothetical protein
MGRRSIEKTFFGNETTTSSLKKGNKSMKTTVIVAAILVFTVGSAPAQNFPVTVNDRVHQYVFKVHNHESTGHRCGLLESKDDLFDNVKTDPAFSALSDERDEVTTGAQAGRTDEYRISYDQPVQQLENFFTARFPQHDYTVSYDQFFHEFHIVPKTVVDPSGAALAIEALQKESGRLVRDLLPFLKNKIEFENYRVEYAAAAVNEATIIYRRIFKGGIVSLKVSYIEMAITPQGRLKSLTIKWPFLAKAEGTAAGAPVDISDGTDAALHEIQYKHSTVSRWTGEKGTIHASAAEITGVALSWFPADQDDGSVLLTPSFSYTTKIKYVEGAELEPVIDVPSLKKYYR